MASAITKEEIPKRNLDKQQLDKASFVLKTIAHPIRLAILQLLHQHERLSVSEICDRIKTEQSVTSHHLSNMKIMGILSASREGKNVYYSLKENSVVDIISLLESMDVNIGVETDPYLKRIDELAQLEDDWDGYGGLKPDVNVIRNTKTLIKWLRVTYRDVLAGLEVEDIYPVSHGTISVDWYCNDTLYTSVEVGREQIYCFIPKDVGQGNLPAGYLDLNKMEQDIINYIIV